jgi:threonylcarbamoyladenosine tRNA methylthiotransferase MtaB
MRPKTIKFYTLGCKVNQYETQSIREQCIRAGFKELINSYPADIYVINTCTVTHRADCESLNLIYRAKRQNPQARIIVTGCLAELGEEIIKKSEPLCSIVKNKDKNRILEFLNKQKSSLLTHNSSLITSFKGHTRAFLKIQDGCDNFCSYCKVPLVRGRSRSRDLSEVIKEAESLVKNGFKEIVLCGICLGAYGKDISPRISLIDVIEALEDIEGLFRIRLSSIEAGDVADDLIDKMASSQKLCRHLHIPIQSGDDKILKRMGRKYCCQDYINLVRKIRSQVPKIAITTDVLVGFPGESEENFRNTADLVKRILPLRVHIFPYSKREGTLAAENFDNKVNPSIIKQRILRLRDIACDCALTYKKRFLNKTMGVLIEGRFKGSPTLWEGLTDNYIRVLVNSKRNLKNQFIPVKLKKIIRDYVQANFN